MPSASTVRSDDKLKSLERQFLRCCRERAKVWRATPSFILLLFVARALDGAWVMPQQEDAVDMYDTHMEMFTSHCLCFSAEFVASGGPATSIVALAAAAATAALHHLDKNESSRPSASLCRERKQQCWHGEPLPKENKLRRRLSIDGVPSANDEDEDDVSKKKKRKLDS